MTAPISLAEQGKQAEVTIGRYTDGDATLRVMGNCAIQIDVGGLVITKSMQGWHKLARSLEEPPSDGLVADCESARKIALQFIGELEEAHFVAGTLKRAKEALTALAIDCSTCEKELSI
jgi:hypothetical protein